MLPVWLKAIVVVLFASPAVSRPIAPVATMASVRSGASPKSPAADAARKTHADNQWDLAMRHRNRGQEMLVEVLAIRRRLAGFNVTEQEFRLSGTDRRPVAAVRMRNHTRIAVSRIKLHAEVRDRFDPKCREVYLIDLALEPKLMPGVSRLISLYLKPLGHRFPSDLHEGNLAFTVMVGQLYGPAGELLYDAEKYHDMVDRLRHSGDWLERLRMKERNRDQ